MNPLIRVEMMRGLLSRKHAQLHIKARGLFNSNNLDFFIFLTPTNPSFNFIASSFESYRSDSITFATCFLQSGDGGLYPPSLLSNHDILLYNFSAVLTQKRLGLGEGRQLGSPHFWLNALSLDGCGRRGGRLLRSSPLLFEGGVDYENF